MNDRDRPYRSFSFSGEMTLEEIEKHVIEQALAACGGNQSEAAARLGISRSTLWRRLKGQ